MCSSPISVLREPSRCILSLSIYFVNVHFLHFPDVNSLICCRLVGGSGDIKLTKDGNTLLKEMVSESEIY